MTAISLLIISLLSALSYELIVLFHYIALLHKKAEEDLNQQKAQEETPWGDPAFYCCWSLCPFLQYLRGHILVRFVTSGSLEYIRVSVSVMC